MSKDAVALFSIGLRSKWLVVVSSAWSIECLEAELVPPEPCLPVRGGRELEETRLALWWEVIPWLLYKDVSTGFLCNWR